MAPLRPHLFPVALTLAVAPMLHAGLECKADQPFVHPGGGATLTAALDGAGTPPGCVWTVPDPEDGRIETDAQGRGRYQAPAWADRTRSCRIQAAWKDAQGHAQIKETTLELRPVPGFPLPPGRFAATAFVPYLPGTPLHQRWLALDRRLRRIVIVHPQGLIEPWQGAGVRLEGGPSIVFNDPCAIAARPVRPGREDQWRLAVVDQGSHVIYEVDAKGEVWRLAGTPGQPGHVDSKATEARFHHPAAVVFRPDGGLLVSDRDNRCIRLVKDGVTDTVAGCSYHALWQDGTGAQAGFLAPGALALDPRTGNLFICDQHRVRFMDPEGGVRTAAGSLEEGFEAWRRNPPTTHGLTRMAGIPCLSHPSALEVDAACDSLRIVDAGNRASRALAIAPGPFQGDLTTLSTQGRAVQAAPDEGSRESKADRKSDRDVLSFGPLAADARDSFVPGETYVAASRPQNAADSRSQRTTEGLASSLAVHPASFAPWDDGTFFIWQGGMGCKACTSPQAQRSCRHVRSNQLLHFYPEQPGARTWRFRVIRFRDGWEPDHLMDLARAGSTLVLVDRKGYHRLHFAGARETLANTRVEQGVDFRSLVALGVPVNNALWAAAPDGALFVSGPGSLVRVPAGDIRRKTLGWLKGGPLQAAGATVRVAVDEGGTAFALDPAGKTLLAFDPPHWKERTVLGPTGGWPRDHAVLSLMVHRGTCFFVMAPAADSSHMQLWTLPPADAKGQAQPMKYLGVQFPLNTRLRFTGDGDLVVMDPLKLSIVPNLAAAAQHRARAAAAQSEAAAAWTAREEDAQAAFEDLVEELARRELQAARQTQQEEGKGARDFIEEPTVAAWEGPAEEIGDEAFADWKSAASATPEPAGSPAAAPADQPRTRRAGQAAGDQALPATKMVRYTPVLAEVNRRDIARILAAFAGDAGFPAKYQQMVKRHKNRVFGFNDHEYEGASVSRDRVEHLLKAKGITRLDDPRLRGLDGRFILATPFVRDLAQWMLRNTHLANHPDEVAAWVEQGRPARPPFSFGFYIQEGQADRVNRIVLELRDLDRFKDRFDRGIQDELKAAGFRTGLSFRDGAGLGRTRGLRLVLFEGCRGVATCHPID